MKTIDHLLAGLRAAIIGDTATAEHHQEVALNAIRADMPPGTIIEGKFEYVDVLTHSPSHRAQPNQEFPNDY